jgi:hypothetical protein
VIYTVEALVQGYGGMNDEPAVISGRQCCQRYKRYFSIAILCQSNINPGS